MLNAVHEATGYVPTLGVTTSAAGTALAEIRLCVKDDAVSLFDCDTVTFTAPPVAAPSPSPSPSSLSAHLLPPYSRSTSWALSILEAVYEAAAGFL